MSIDINNPYVGLRPFHAEESLLFFGRDEQTLELLQRLHDHHFVAVVGSSGCGKSSLLRAGLIPSLKGGYLVDDNDQWLISIMKPGQSPLFNLAESILKEINPKAKPDEISELVKKIKEEGIDAILDIVRPFRVEKHTNFFLLVDQFEELFRFSVEKENASRKDEAIDFVNIILELSTQTIIPFYVVFTMRSDFIGDCTQYHGLPEAMNKSQYLVPRLNRRQLKLVIEGPARLYGGDFSTVLTSKLLNKLGQIKDELPLLQHILMRIWDFEEHTDKSGELDIKDYNHVGGLKKGLSNHAEEAADGMTEREKSISKEMFKALTAIDENGRKIRRPLLLSDLKELTGATYAELEEVIDHFIRDKRSFLIVEKAGDTNDKVIDISHESLIRQWDTLGKWVDEEQESASYYLQLAEATRLNKLKKKDFLAGSELVIALDWKNKFNPTPVWANRYKTGFQDCLTYLENSEIELNRVNLREKKRKKIKIITVGAIVVLVGFIAAMRIYSGIEEEIRNKSFGLFIDGSEIRTVNPTIALDSMSKAINIYPELPSIFYDIAKETYYNNEQYITILEGTPGAKTPVIFDQSGKGNFYISGNKKYVLEIFNGLTGEFIDKEGYINTIELPKEPSTSTTIPEDEGYLVGFKDGTITHYGTDGKEIQAYNSKITSKVRYLLLAKNNANVLVVHENNIIILLDITNGEILYKQKFEARVLMARISSDGKHILSRLANSTIQIIEVESRKNYTIEGENNIASIIFSPDEEQVLLGYKDGKIEAFDLKEQLIEPILKIRDGIKRINISPNSGKIFITTRNSWVLLNELYEVILDEQVFETKSNNVALAGFFYENGELLVTFYSDYNTHENVMQLYTIVGEKIGKEIRSKRFGLKFTNFSNSKSLRVESRVKEYGQLFNSKGQKLRKVDEVYGDKKITFSSDGRKIIINNSKEIGVYNIEDSTKIKVNIYKLNHDGNITAVIHKNNQLVVANARRNGRNEIILMNEVNSGYDEESSFHIDEDIHGNNGVVSELGLSPDGKHVIIGYSRGYLLSVNLDTRKHNKYINGHISSITGIEFTKNGNYFYTSSLDKSIKKWSRNSISPLRSFTKSTSAINFIKLLPDDSNILSGSINGNIILWGKYGGIFNEYKGHNNEAITSISISKDGKLITASEDGAVKSWHNYNSNTSIRSYENMSSISQINDSVLKVVSNYRRNIIGHNIRRDLNYISYDSINDMRSRNADFKVYNKIFLSPKGNRYFMVKNDSAVLKHINGDLIKAYRKFDYEISTITFSKDEKNVFVGSKDGTLIMVDSLGSIVFKENNNASETNIDNEINLISISNDKTIATISFKGDSIVYKFDLKTRDRKRFQGLSSEITSHDISHDGKYLIAGSIKGETSIWSMEEHREPISILNQDGAITTVKFSPDGKYVFTGSSNGKGFLWLINEEEIVQRFEANQFSGEIIEAEFSSKGDLLFIGSRSGFISVYNIDAKETFSSYLKNKEGVKRPD